MSDDAPAVTRPDLSALLESDPETVAHLILAEIGGATWNGRSGVWVLVCENLLRAYAWIADDDPAPRVTNSLPRPLHDDGDVWRLMIRESLRPRRTGPTWWRVWWVEPGNSGYCEGPDPRRQAVKAALTKYADDPRWSSLIPSVIERLP
jgi:hypothetical protein